MGNGFARPWHHFDSLPGTGNAHGSFCSGVTSAFVNGAVALPATSPWENGEVVAVGSPVRGEASRSRGSSTRRSTAPTVSVTTRNVDDILDMSVAFRRDGVIAFQPTLITSDLDQFPGARENLREARRRQHGRRENLHINLEGPSFSPERSGTHPVEHLRAPDVELLDQLLEGDDVAMNTIAPELPGALAAISFCVKRGVIVSLGHSAANVSEARAGFERGRWETVLWLHPFQRSGPDRAPETPGRRGAHQ